MSWQNNIKDDFPIFQANPGLVYLDSTASSQKPQSVIDAERFFYENYYSNVHRGVYALSQKATDAYEGSREKVRKFINARSVKEIVYVRNTTEAINLVANTLGRKFGANDIILTTEMEHHSNIVPWQKIRDEQGSKLEFLPVTTEGDLAIETLASFLSPKVKLVTITQMSNVLGVVNDIKEIIRLAHKNGSLVLVDAAQSAPHLPIDVQDLDADFLVFSGHKMLGPTGIGVLYAKENILDALPPFLRGGDMILEVTKEGATWNDLPWRFEAGTPNIAGAIGLGAAIDYLNTLGMANVWEHEQELMRYGLEQFKTLTGVHVLGAGAKSPRGAIFAFDIPGAHPHDIGSILDEQGVAVRAGNHCAMPLHQKFGLVATARASCYIYNSKEDIDALIAGVRQVQSIFA